jgi:hypothetical protein
MDITSHQIENSALLREVNEFIDNTNWYVLALNRPTDLYLHQYLSRFTNSNNQRFPLISKINPDGTWPGQDLSPDENGNIPVDHIIKTVSIIRQPYGWDDASTARRAPPIYKLFQYVNSTFFDNSFTLDGFPEEVTGARHLFYDENEKDIPGWGTSVGPSGSRYDEGQPDSVWTAYANGKTPATRRMALNFNRGISNGAHRDWDGMWGEENSGSDDDIYSIIVCVNETWKYGEGLEIILYETIPPGPDVSVHERRGYGVGRPTHIFPHAPGQVILFPAKTIHTTTAPGTIANNSVLGKNVVFRVRKKS